MPTKKSAKGGSALRRQSYGASATSGGEKTIKSVKRPAVKKRGRPKKKEIVLPEKEQKAEKIIVKRDYLFAVGRRKSAIARIRFYSKKENGMEINSKQLSEFFPTQALQRIVQLPQEVAGVKNGYLSIKTNGGGKKGQAEGISLGIARVLEKYDPNLRAQLKKAGLLRRDARVKERKKYGLKRARRAPQWQKR
ncbi:MAG: 30S ribosomal protein S9 [Candidatus Kerfeldbacteria bacterium CG_4_10_14_0_8_um_filter_42_10]|uniref:Small ribosomal subunit protein uS9 n=1 Tax=Candidatus Kerfeldbacteria bacterium CG_4_10_14_0_8_um_filter_42_10 TaxID=2014248 RepID=A0A2M7RIL0_9BACT|nr:MAG: 30S ribosomal protein S9 [Candidatus Kerfeldbacteria bacterium CG_4_10_14_0_8_um_filter_42_10]